LILSRMSGFHGYAKYSFDIGGVPKHIDDAS
jgi:hypothetical protein